MKTVHEKVAVLVTLLVLIGLPLTLFGYQQFYLPYRFHDARIVKLTALATDGVWTEEAVDGTNYWRKHFTAVPEIRVRPGEALVLRVASADVLHSFSIPALNIGPIDVPAGEVREVQFTPEKPGTLIFLCWQVCSPVHERLRGKIVVVGAGGSSKLPSSVQEPEL
ncbi:MAG: hypothetical protein KGN36_13185 [Acidobacteriota bacterium]|nr:hypothetical protein [Acidobacteriota bacterium]